MTIGIITLLVIVFVLFYLYHLRKISMQQERVANTLWNMEHTNPQPLPVGEGSESSQDDNPAGEPSTPQPHQKEQKSGSAGSGSAGGGSGSLFLSRFREAVEARLEDSDLSVDDLAADMNLSRVQLYRKVKAVTGASPVELLRTARLHRAYQLLLTTDKSVSEVAYTVGFTAPSYFTKCFKEEYGKVPGDVRKN
jgi:AraC-like DNA-binding protein